jgi:hypothetical protein
VPGWLSGTLESDQANIAIRCDPAAGIESSPLATSLEMFVLRMSVGHRS